MTTARIETYSGKMFDILDPQPDQFSIEDIAHALGMICRFTGHVRYFYSVAQHSWHGSYLTARRHRLEFLLHDASEAFVGDMNRPLKHQTAAGAPYREVEQKIMKVIREKFNLPEEQSPEIQQIDNQMLYAEKEQLMGKAVWSKELVEECDCADRQAANIIIYPMSPTEAEQSFLERFRELTGENRWQ